MLICTNDGFTGVDGLRLPGAVGQTVVANTAAYDAGTEANTEDFGDIVPPCQAVIGVRGNGPLPPEIGGNDGGHKWEREPISDCSGNRGPWAAGLCASGRRRVAARAEACVGRNYRRQ